MPFNRALLLRAARALRCNGVYSEQINTPYGRLAVKHLVSCTRSMAVVDKISIKAVVNRAASTVPTTPDNDDFHAQLDGYVYL